MSLLEPIHVLHSQHTDNASGDDHTQYALLAGRSGGQTQIGGTGSGDNLTLQSTSHATKGKIALSDRLDVDIGSTSTTYVGAFIHDVSAGSTLIKLENGAAASTSNAAGFEFRMLTSTSTRTAGRLVGSLSDTTDASRTGTFQFHLSDNGSFPEVARFVGRDLCIGTTSPLARLHVVENGSDAVARFATSGTGDNRIQRLTQYRTTTTDATTTTLATIAISASKTYMIEARVVARRTGGTGGTADDGATYIRRASYTTKSGTVTLLGSVDAAYTAEDQSLCDCTFTISGTNVLLRVTGTLLNNFTWHGHVTVWEVGS